MPNSTSIQSVATGRLPTAVVSPTVHIFDDTDLNRSLVSYADYCNNGCHVILDSTSATIIHTASGRVINKTAKEATARLWPFHSAHMTPAPTPAASTATEHTANTVVRNDIHADRILYAHQSMFSPADSQMAKALAKGYLDSYPGISAKMFNQNKPHSTATAKGHMDRTRKNLHSTRSAPKVPRVITSTHAEPSSDDTDIDADNTAYLRIVPLDTSDGGIHSDATGAFPFTSSLGNRYTLISCYNGHIHAELLATLTADDLVAAFDRLFRFYRDNNHTPTYQRLDNHSSQTGSLVDAFFRDTAKIPLQFVPPGNHRTLRAERCIRTWKNHFIAGLSTVDPNFPVHLWDQLYEQAELTLNHLIPWRPNPAISAHAGFYGRSHDFSRHPIHPPGVRCLIFTGPDERESWEAHCREGFYLGPALRHYRSFHCWSTSPAAHRYTDTIETFPAKLHMPGSNPHDVLLSALESIESTFATQAPTRTSTSTAARLLSDAVDKAKSLIASQAEEQRVLTTTPAGAPAPDTRQQRVLPTPAAPAHPTDSNAPARRRDRKAQNVYQRVTSHEIAKDKLLLQYVHKCFTDTDDNTHWQITGIYRHVVLSKGVRKPKLFFRYYDTVKFPRCPTAEDDFEHQPCFEIFKYSNGALVPRVNYIRWDTPGSAHATFHSSANDRPLNVNPQGGKLTFHDAIIGPDKEAWNIAEGEEIGRLIDSATARPRHRSEQPADRRKDTTYYNPKPKEKLDDKRNIVRRIRGTLGGDRIHYPGETTSPVAEKVLINLHWLSVVSDRRNTGKDIRYATMDLKDFYLGSKLLRPEWVRIKVSRIPEATRIKYNLNDFIDNGSILFEVNGSMYGHSASGRLANADLVKHLAAHGYTQNADLPCLFEHASNGISFTLVVDDFGIKYDHANIEALYDLKRILEIRYPEVHFDITGKKYIGVTLNWNYSENWFETSMPTVVPAALARFCPNGLPRGVDSPATYTAFTPGKPNLSAKEDTSPLLNSPEKTEFIQQVVGVYLHYARMADPLMLPAVSAISETQANPTEETLAATLRLIAYSVTHPCAIMRYHACDMVLRIISDGSHQSRSGSRSVAGGYHYCTNKDDTTTINAPVSYFTQIIPTVCGAASETEYASAYINGQNGMLERQVLAALHYPQSTTDIITDNQTAAGIVSRTVKLKRSKAMDMRYHWIRERSDHGIYRVLWEKGSTNVADYFTKPLPVWKTRNFAQLFVRYEQSASQC